ncbi:MAG: hypothetical protein AB7O24_21080 [Kofleriaceae bacterium]
MRLSEGISRVATTLFLVAIGCGGGSTAGPAGPAAPTTGAPATTAGAGSTGDSTPTAGAPAAPRHWNAVETNPQPGVGKDYLSDAMVLFRVVTCGGNGAIPQGLDPDVVNKHCARLTGLMQGYRDKYLAKAEPFFASIRPKDLPPTVVYPFGGGDLLSALTTYPDAQEITTISLEYAGDPRRVIKLTSKKDLEKNLKLFDDTMATLLSGDWNWTRNMEEMQKNGLPGQIGSSLIGLVIHGYEPVSMRFFKLLRDGTVDYLDEAEIKAAENTKPEKLRAWGAPDWSDAFSNCEIRFRAQGGKGPVKVFRHIAANLSDHKMTKDPKHLSKNPSLLAHLEAKGHVSALTRAASHLLWEDSFTLIRDYLIEHIEWMPSDSTGIPPPFAEAAGLVQDTYGSFEGAYEPSDQGHKPQYNEHFKALFAKNPPKPLDFRYGYPDVNKRGHMIVTRRVK